MGTPVSNDEFLHRLRKAPPAAFRASLKAQLDRQARAERRPRRSSTFRALAIGILIGGAAFAVTSLTRWDVSAIFARSATDEDAARGSGAARDARVPPRSVAGRVPGGVDEPAGSAQTSGPRAQPTAASSQPGAEGERDGTATGAASEHASASGAATSSTLSARALRRHPFVVGPASTKKLVDEVARSTRGGDFTGTEFEALDTTAALRRLCESAGPQHPDMAIAFRRMSDAELEGCEANRVDEIVEIFLGYQVVVLTRTPHGVPLTLSPRQVFLALARDVPDPRAGARWIPNPYRSWEQIDPALPNTYIEVYGPSRLSPVRTLFLELVVEAGCRAHAAPKGRDCHALRDDGVFVEAEPGYDLVAQRLGASPNALAVLDYRNFQLAAEHLAGSVLAGPPLTTDTLSAGTYSASRPVFLYINRKNVRVRNFRFFATSFVSATESWFYEGLLVPLGEKAREDMRMRALNLSPIMRSGGSGS